MATGYEAKEISWASASDGVKVHAVSSSHFERPVWKWASPSTPTPLPWVLIQLIK